MRLPWIRKKCDRQRVKMPVDDRVGGEQGSIDLEKTSGGEECRKRCKRSARCWSTSRVAVGRKSLGVDIKLFLSPLGERSEFRPGGDLHRRLFLDALDVLSRSCIDLDQLFHVDECRTLDFCSGLDPARFGHVGCRVSLGTWFAVFNP